MGWKAVRDHYRIEHSVQVTDAGICIGSPYIHDIIVVSKDGEIVKPYPKESDRGWSINEDLKRYCDEMKADPEKLRELVAQPDTFGPTTTVFTYEGGDIIELQAEQPEWPNVTTDGRIQYENTFSTDRDQVVRWAIRNAEAGISFAEERLSRAAEEKAEAERYLERRLQNLAKLTASVDRNPKGQDREDGLGAQHESAVPKADAQPQSPQSHASPGGYNDKS